MPRKPHDELDKQRKVPPCEACMKLTANGIRRKCEDCRVMNDIVLMGKIENGEIKLTESDKCKHCDHSYEDHNAKDHRCPITNKHPRSWGLSTYERKTYACHKCKVDLTNHGRYMTCSRCGAKHDVPNHLIYAVL